MAKWWRRSKHHLTRAGIVLLVLLAAAVSVPVMRALLGLIGLAISVASLAALMVAREELNAAEVAAILGPRPTATT